MDNFYDYVNGDKKISLRIIDWFVTNYSKKFNIFYCIYCNQDGKNTFDKEGNYIHKHFNTYQSYKSQLKSYSKKKFDPFCRRQRIEFEYKEGQKIETTVGQLNFFKWAIENLIIDYILLHYSEIEQDMNQILRGFARKSHHGAQVHQEATVAVQTQDFAIGLGKGQTKGYVGSLAHSTGDREVQFFV